MLEQLIGLGDGPAEFHIITYSSNHPPSLFRPLPSLPPLLKNLGLPGGGIGSWEWNGHNWWAVEDRGVLEAGLVVDLPLVAVVLEGVDHAMHPLQLGLLLFRLFLFYLYLNLLIILTRLSRLDASLLHLDLYC